MDIFLKRLKVQCRRSVWCRTIVSSQEVEFMQKHKLVDIHSKYVQHNYSAKNPSQSKAGLKKGEGGGAIVGRFNNQQLTSVT